MQNIDITIPKCDYLGIPFIYKINGKQNKLKENDIIYFSVKENLSDKDYIIQKTLNNGIEYKEQENKYYITFNYDDTKNLAIGSTYIYDLTIYYNKNKPVQKIYGNIKIGPKVTLNEVI